MEILELVLMFLAAVLVSAVLEPFIRRTSLPLVQMLIGVAIFFFIDLPAELSLDSDIFLVLFIAPLLFNESRNVSNKILWENLSGILLLAIGLVIALVLAIGFTLHWIVPSVPLAAAFALGAALGPTDAVAVTALGKDLKLNTRQHGLLSGEALLNDASGIVSFQFAIAAAVTGSFSIAEASTTFLIEFFGGIGIGLALGFASFLITRWVRKTGLESITFHVCFEVFLPFFVYLVAQQVHTSGVIAVVTAGLLLTYIPQVASPASRSFTAFSTRLSLASGSVWDLLSFVLNGIIFTYLGIMLPSTITSVMQTNEVGGLWVIGIIVLITLVAEGVRFIWIAVMDFLSTNPDTGGRFQMSKDLFRNALVTTLSGPKGAVSLTIAMTIPTTVSATGAFPQRDLLLLITCGVIILTLFLANYAVPLIAPQSEEDGSDEIDPTVEISMLKAVINGLKEYQTPENKHACGVVIRTYSRRITNLRKRKASNKQLRFIRQEVLVKQREYIESAMANDEIDRKTAEVYLKRIKRSQKILTSSRQVKKGKSKRVEPINASTSVMQRVRKRISKKDNDSRMRLEFRANVEKVAVDYLDGILRTENEKDRKTAARALISEHQALLSALRSRLHALDRSVGIDVLAPEQAAEGEIARSKTGTLYIDKGDTEDDDADEDDYLTDMWAIALHLELDQLQEKYEQNKVSGPAMREAREEIYLLQMGLSENDDE